MPGFRFCSFCNGKGCIGCDAEERSYAKKAMANAPQWRKPDIRDVRNQALRDETKRLESLIGVTISTQEEFREIESRAHAEIEAAFKPALDAEYARQFPGGPKPIFTVNRANSAEMAELKNVFGCEALEKAFAPDGRGMEEILENCDAANARLGKERTNA